MYSIGVTAEGCRRERTSRHHRAKQKPSSPLLYSPYRGTARVGMRVFGQGAESLPGCSLAGCDVQTHYFVRVALSRRFSFGRRRRCHDSVHAAAADASAIADTTSSTAATAAGAVIAAGMVSSSSSSRLRRGQSRWSDRRNTYG